MALITCPQCGKQFSDRAEKCPQCGTSKEKILYLIKEQEEREAAERERIRKERETKPYALFSVFVHIIESCAGIAGLLPPLRSPRRGAL